MILTSAAATGKWSTSFTAATPTLPAPEPPEELHPPARGAAAVRARVYTAGSLCAPLTSARVRQARSSLGGLPHSACIRSWGPLARSSAQCYTTRSRGKEARRLASR